MSLAAGASVCFDRDAIWIRDVDYPCRVEQIDVSPGFPLRWRFCVNRDSISL
jgi:hypothetical protein